MKIMVVTPYFMPMIGGLENYAYNVARELRDQFGDDVFVVTANHMSGGYMEDEYEGIRVIRLPVLLRFSNTPLHPLWYFMLRKIIKAEKPDIINSHSPVPYMADMALLAAGKTATVVTYHAGSMKKAGGMVNLILGAYEKFILPMLFKRAGAIASVYPEFIEKRLRSRDMDKVFYAPPCIDPATFMPASTGMRTPQGVFKLLYVGKVHSAYDWKGLSVLLEAVRLIVKKNKNIELSIVGEGDAVAKYKALTERLGITQYVTFKGAMRGKQLAGAYQSAMVHILPSISDAEAFGTVVIEAMACGTPVIASRVGGVPRTIESTGGGRLVEPNSPHAIAAAVLQLIANEPLRVHLAETGLQNVRNNFTWPAMVAAYREHFTRLTAKKRTLIVQVTPYFPPHLGGMENVVQEIAQQLVVRDYAVRVITSDLGYAHNFSDREELRNKVVRLRSSEFARLPILWNLFPKLLTLPRRSTLHVHVAQAFVSEVALLSAKLRGSAFIAHFHLDVNVSGGTFSFIFAAYKKVLFPWMLRCADRVIVFSTEQQELVITKYGVLPERVAIIPNGVAIADSARPRVYKNDGKRLLYVGRLSAQKRVDRLISTMRYLPADIRLDIVGDGDKMAELRAQVSQSNLRNVTFHGALFGAALQAMYQKADMFVMASEHEGMPLVILEAMAECLPICASNVVGIRELVQGYGVLVDDLNPKAFADEIQRNLQADRLVELSAASLRNARKYSWKSIIARIGELYNEVTR